MSGTGHHDDRPETALEEVLDEAARAAKRTTDSPRSEEHRGEAAEAITPNAQAQEESQGD
ncbi:hypothetical protein [Streptomyces sp. NPDC051636]|uniref:hypothetical protein n=1 Tax=Streptomyces sp. NPDC051636 TaxID=3365663 RepID=UPI00378A262C